MTDRMHKGTVDALVALAERMGRLEATAKLAPDSSALERIAVALEALLPHVRTIAEDDAVPHAIGRIDHELGELGENVNAHLREATKALDRLDETIARGARR